PVTLDCGGPHQACGCVKLAFKLGAAAEPTFVAVDSEARREHSEEAFVVPAPGVAVVLCAEVVEGEWVAERRAKDSELCRAASAGFRVVMGVFECVEFLAGGDVLGLAAGEAARVVHEFPMAGCE